MDKTCPVCGSYSPEYLLSREWKDELKDLLCKLENIQHLSDAKHMSELELLALFISLKNKQ